MHPLFPHCCHSGRSRIVYIFGGKMLRLALPATLFTQYQEKNRQRRRERERKRERERERARERGRRTKSDISDISRASYVYATVIQGKKTQ
jgi:hypothetical protein